MIKPNRAMFYAMLAGFFSVWQKKNNATLEFCVLSRAHFLAFSPAEF